MIKALPLWTHAGPSPLSGHLAEILRESVPPRVYYFRVIRPDGTVIVEPIGPFSSSEEAIKAAHRWPGLRKVEDVET